MSDLTSHAWAVKALDQLRRIEQQCAEQDLFCVGYLIPQVELVEMQYQDQCVDAIQWQEWLIEYVRVNMTADQLQQVDSDCIEKLMVEL